MIYRLSIACEALDALDFLFAGADKTRSFFSTADGKMIFAGFGMAGEGVEILKSVELLNDALSARLFGGFAFDDTVHDGAWSRFPNEKFWLHEFEYLWTPEGSWVTINCANKDMAAERLQQLLAGLPRYSSTNNAQETHALVDRTQWNWMVEQAIEQILPDEPDGLKKVVLARPLRVRSPQDIDPLQALERLNQAYPNTYRFLIELDPGYSFIGATPEQLVKVTAGNFETIALAGSIQRGTTEAEDAVLANELLSSAKNRLEHQLVVDDLLVELDSLTEDLEIPAEPIIYALPNVQHLMTPIRAKLKNETHILALVKALHPTPALGGLPRDKALALIHKLETYPRGWYGAPLGWFDIDGNGEFVVTIRSAVIAKNMAWAYAGAGIMADSDPAIEWEETNIKLQPMLSAFGVNDD